MAYFKAGDQGDAVKRWQTFLQSKDFKPGAIDGDFGGNTIAATKAFQAAHGLAADGIVGNGTMDAAKAEGFSGITDDLPPPPPFPALLSTEARKALFGSFDYAPGPGGSITILGGWERDNITTVTIPQLQSFEHTNSGHIRWHKAAKDQFIGLWATWDSKGLLKFVKTWGGGFVPRFQRGSTTNLSNHAFGTAFDINVEWNGLGCTPALSGETGCVRDLVGIANEHGFYWGGHFHGRRDGMHFEIAKLH